MIPDFIKVKFSRIILESHNWNFGKSLNVNFKDYECLNCGSILFNRWSKDDDHFWDILDSKFDKQIKLTCGEILIKEVLE